MVVKAVYEGGVFRPREPVELDDHTEVELEIRSSGPPAGDHGEDPTGWKALDSLIGFNKGGPAEPIGEDHDRHLYRR